MNCPSCGAQTGGRALFCGKCGHRLAEPEQGPIRGLPRTPGLEQAPTQALPAVPDPEQAPAEALPTEPEGAAQRSGGCTRTLTVLVLAATIMLLVAGVGVLATYLGLRDRAETISEAADIHYQKGVAHLAAGEHELAIAELELVLQLQPGHGAAAESLEQARSELQTQATPTPVLRQQINVSYFADLAAAHAARDWARVIELADLLWSVDPSHRREDVEDMLLDAFYGSAMDLVSDERVEEAIRLFDRTIALDPHHAEAKRQRELAALYTNGLNYWGADWPTALEHLATLYEREPEYLDVRDRVYEGYLRYGDAIGRDGDWCDAVAQYARAHELAQTTEAARKQALAADRCHVAEPGAGPEGTATPRGTRVPSEVFVGRVTEQTPLQSDKIYIRGRIVDARGSGVDGVRVEIKAWDWSVVHTSSGNGSFSFDGLNQPVTYTLRLLDFPSVAVDVPTEWGKISWVLFEESP